MASWLLFVGVVAAVVARQPEIAQEQPSYFGGVYRTVERIAEGGIGVVFRAEDTRDGGPLAIKAALSTRESDAAAIRREIVALSRLDHRGIVHLRGYGVQRAGPWIALELLQGRTLAEEIRRDWRETATSGGHLIEACSIVQQLCLALDHVHARGLVHRDVKPANVFLGADDRVTLIDFGLACSATAPEARAVRVGTMEYAAPEQIAGGPIDHRADIYSVGCLLYELLTGQRPSRGDSSNETAGGPAQGALVAPSRLIADVPSALDGLVMAMLAPAPGQRPASAAEIARQLGGIERGRRAAAAAMLEPPPPGLDGVR